jgi:HTH-type transcriptional regulator/antitoxin HipB
MVAKSVRSCLWGSAVAESLGQLAQQVRERRKSLHLTQEGLADLAGCSPRFVGMVEGGKPSVRLDKLVDLLDVLGLELTASRRQTS